MDLSRPSYQLTLTTSHVCHTGSPRPLHTRTLVMNKHMSSRDTGTVLIVSHDDRQLRSPCHQRGN